MKKKKKSKLGKIIRGFFVLVIVIILIALGTNTACYLIGEEVQTADGEIVTLHGKKDVIHALICGVNDNLTDTMMYVRYDVKNGNIAMMSVPRDTYVENEYCVGNKLNGIYRGKNIIPLVKEIQDLLDVKLDYYVVFDTDIVHQIIDEIGGVEIEVPFRMKYDDPTQDLHIDLQPGVQLLNGEQVEQFVRFRHNNDMSVGYAMGDLGRIKTQQEFMKTLIATLLQPKNLLKAKELINITVENTDTNVTVSDILKYITSARKIKIDHIQTTTAAGSARYINGLSYFLLDEEETQRIIKEDFL